MAKYLIDHNLPAQLAHAIRELCSHDKSVEVYALTDKFPANAKDADWITALADEGDWVIISQDRFRKGNTEKEALRRSGLTVFFLSCLPSNGRRRSIGRKLTTLFAGGHPSWIRRNWSQVVPHSRFDGRMVQKPNLNRQRCSL